MKKSMSVFLGLTAAILLAEPAQLTIIGDWTVQVSAQGKTATVSIEPMKYVQVKNERYDSLKEFTGKRGWRSSTPLRPLLAMECTVPNALLPQTVVVKSSDLPDAVVYERGQDFGVEETWANVGRIASGRIGENQPVFLDYTYGSRRLDAIVLTADGNIVIRTGIPRANNPVAPALQAGEIRLANIYLKGQPAKLTENNLLPILETSCPPLEKINGKTPAEEYIPKTMAKLKNGEKVRILAWGDSVTNGGFLPKDKIDTDRWQIVFAKRLQEKYPQAQIELISESWGGRCTSDYLKAPEDSDKNYQKKVLDVKPDLIVSEFVNDGSLPENVFLANYNRIYDDFQAIGAEWIIVAPHYTSGNLGACPTEKNCDEDVRLFVKNIHRFAAEKHLAVGDASRHYGRLWRRGIPFSSLLLNGINHPNSFGLSLFADALMDLF